MPETTLQDGYPGGFPSDRLVEGLYERSNYESHSVMKRCFPPRPDRCSLCDKEGDDLWLHPCCMRLDFDEAGTNAVHLQQ